MKTTMRIKKVLGLACAVLIATSSIVAQSKITIESDRALNHDFSKYKTFTFSSMIDSDLEAGLYFLNDLIFKGQIREAVREELMGLGYNMDKTNPDLVVTFRVFDKPTTIQGFEGYGNSYWGDRKYREISDKTKYDVEAGTLLLSFADRKTSKVIWQGFASGLINNERFIKDEVKIREAVTMLLDEYGQRANEYTRK